MRVAEKIVVAVDPGSSKCGIAIVRRPSEGELELLARAIVPTADVLPALNDLREEHRYEEIILGNGTTSKNLAAQIRDAIPGVPILKVDEKDTSMEARAKYWEVNKRRGWRRMLPATLQSPPEPIDDFAALIIAERVLGV